MKTLFLIFRKHSSIIITVSVFLAIALLNSLMYVELNPDTDSIESFVIALKTDNIFIGTSRMAFTPRTVKNDVDKIFAALFYNQIYFENGCYEAFPCISRYFTNILPHLSVTIPHFLFSVNDVNVLLKIFTFSLHFTPIIFLLIIYLLLPKKETFEIILLSFLTYMVYLRYYLLTETILTALFSWAIFNFYLYKNFNKLSLFDSIIILSFSFLLISSHPIVVIIIPILFFLGIKKLSESKNIILVCSLFLLFIAWIFNMFYTFNSVGTMPDFYSLESLQDFNLYLILSVILILTISMFKKNNILMTILLILFAVIIGIIVTKTSYPAGFNARILACYITFLFMIFLIFVLKFNIYINYKFIKFINIIMILSIFISSIGYAKTIYNHNLKIKHYMQTHDLIDINEFKIKYSAKNKYILILSVIMNSIMLKPDYNCKIALNDMVLPQEIINHSRILKNFNIDIDKIYKGLSD